MEALALGTDNLDDLVKRSLDVDARLGRRFNKIACQSLGHGVAFFARDLTLSHLVAFVAYQH